MAAPRWNGKRRNGQARHPRSSYDDEIRAEIAPIRHDGYYYYQSRVFGVASVSVPIIDADGICVAGVQVAGDILDLTEHRVPILSIEVRRAASAITDRIS